MSEGVSGSVERNKRLAELANKAFLKREECSAPSAGADQSGAETHPGVLAARPRSTFPQIVLRGFQGRLGVLPASQLHASPQ